MLKLPNTDSPIRELFDMDALANWKTLGTYRQAIRAGKNFLKADRAAKSVHVLSIRANGEIHLTYIGPRGGIKRIWNFGCPI